MKRSQPRWYIVKREGMYLANEPPFVWTPKQSRCARFPTRAMAERAIKKYGGRLVLMPIRRFAYPPCTCGKLGREP